mgnify:CR=1 FL=1
MGYVENEILLYDLSNRPASYDAVTCIATAIALGCKHVRFVYGAWKPKNYTIRQAHERWESIVRPAAALFGLTYSIGERRGVEVNHMLHAAIKTYNATGKIGKIPVPCVPRDYVTLTLRKSRNPERDSNEEESLKFAARCDREVVIIRDWDETPLSIEDRMQIYAGAFVNIMVINGPLTLCIHSNAPYISMRTIGCERSGSTSPAFSAKNGITPGFQFPWANPNQKLSYLTDTAENLEFEYHAFGRVIKQEKAA